MLVERGSISVDQLHQGLAASRQGGQRLGTHLVDLGFINEGALLEALADQHGVPYVSESILLEYLRSFDGVMLPPPMIHSLRVVPFRKVRDRIQVAMSNPGDPETIDRIANYTQLHVEPFIASDRTIELAMDRVPPTGTADVDSDEDLLTDVVREDEVTSRWDDLWSSHVDPRLLLQMHSRPKATHVVLMARFPTLEPVGSDGARAGDLIREDVSFVRLLGAATSAAEVGETLVRFAARRLDRIGLFAVHHGKISGWMGRGLPLDAREIRDFSVAANVPSLFWELEDHDSYVGAIPAGQMNDELLEVLGQPAPAEVVVVPMALGGRVKGYLVGDNPGRTVSNTICQELALAARASGDALGVVLRGRPQ